ncbi:hypothetical protein CN184_06250 [Sinorhizobium medicae]|nr:hypothetical protein CN184_06250 [Sinorhizobium medicae]
MQILVAQFRLMAASLLYGFPYMSRGYLHRLPGNSFTADNAKRFRRFLLLGGENTVLSSISGFLG